MALKQRQRRRQRIANQVARQAGRQARRAKQQANFIGPYTPKQAHKVAVKQTRTEYRPTEREIASQIRGSKKREGEISDWYSQLGQQYATAQQSAASAADTANAATAAGLQQSSQNTAALIQGLAGQDAAFAAQVGGPTNVAGQNEQVAAAAAAERMRAALQAPITAARANNVAAYGSRRASAVLAGIQAHKAETANRRKEQSDLRALKQERGGAVAKKIGEFREQDQNLSIQRAALGVKGGEVAAKKGYNKAIVTQAKLGLKGKQASAAAQENAARLYSEGKITAAQYQERVAKIQRGASKIKAKSNVDVAKIQGQNAKRKGASSGARSYSIAEAEQFADGAGQNFATPGDIVRYLVNIRKVDATVAKRAAGRLWRQHHR